MKATWEEQWTQEHKAKFLQALGALQVHHEKTTNDALDRLFLNAISKSCRPEAAITAMEKLLLTSKWMPKISDVHEIVNGTAEVQAVKAWDILITTISEVGIYQSVQFEDPKISWALSMLGGWQQVCMADQNRIHFTRKDFINLYVHMGTPTGNIKHRGLIEQQSIVNGILPPRCVTISRQGNIGVPCNNPRLLPEDSNSNEQ